MATARRKETTLNDRVERLERRVAELEVTLHADAEDAEDERLIKEAWLEQGGRPLTPWAKVKRQLGVKTS